MEQDLVLRLSGNVDQVLRPGCSFALCLQVWNQSKENLEDIVIAHCLGEGLETQNTCGKDIYTVCCLPKNACDFELECLLPDCVELMKPPNTKKCSFNNRFVTCQAECDITPHTKFVLITIPLLKAGRKRTFRYDVVVTDEVPFLSKATHAKVLALTKNEICQNARKVCISSNKLWMGNTPITPKPFSISQAL